MTDPQNASGPSAPPEEGTSSEPREPPLIRQFVMDYLQQHGYDRVLKTLNEGLASANGAAAASSSSGPADQPLEAVFIAPPPIDLTNSVTRNLPQAQAVSASTMSERITPEFEAQAKYIIQMMERHHAAELKVEEAMEAGKELPPGEEGDVEVLLDTSERVQGYRLYRQWVDRGLDLWKRDRKHHELLHPSDVAQLSSITNKQMIGSNSFCQRLLYTVCLSRNSHDLLVQWLSGAGLDEGWEAGLHVAKGRAKEAIKSIVFNRINITVSNSHTPLDAITLVSSSGLLSSLLPSQQTIQAFNTATNLKLGPPPKTDRLKEQVARTLADADAEAAAQPDGPPTNHAANGNHQANGTAQGEDVDMENAPTAPQISISLPTPGVGDPSNPNPPQTIVLPTIPDDPTDPSLVSPDLDETLPPVPPIFKIAELKREVEAVRDKRKMIRLGPTGSTSASTGTDGSALNGTSVPPVTVLPSIVAYTLFDGGEGVSSVEFSHDSSLIAVGSAESCVRIWSMKKEKLKAKSIGSLKTDEGMSHRKLIGHSGPVYSLSFDPIYGSAEAPSTLLSSSQDGTVRLWSMDTYTNLVVYRGHGKDPVWDVEWGPMGVYFATASRDRTARLWSSDRVSPLRIYAGHLSDVNCVKFHPNSLYLATGSMDNTCRLWDVQRGACLRLFMGHSDAVTTVTISPDGKTLASAGLDQSIWLWDLGSSRPIKRMTGHKAPIHSLSFSAESAVLVSGSADSTVRVWDVKSAGGERGSGSARSGGDAETRGGLPMGPDDFDSASTSDLLATYPTKRTPILKTQYTPRNLCMVAGTFIPPSNVQRAGVGR